MGEYRKFINTVYLSGPMDNLSANTEDPKLSMSIWREKAENCFSKKDIKVANPLRIPTDINTRWIIRGDKLSIQHSDALLVNISQIGQPGINGKAVMGAGTIMEIMYAHALGESGGMVKPIAVIDTERKYNEISVWIRYHASVVCETQEEAIKWLVSLNAKRIRPDFFVDKVILDDV